MPPAEHASFWKTEAKMMSAFTCKYHPFSTGDTWISHDVICRPRPEFPLPVPPHGKQLVWSVAGIHAKTVRTQLFGSKVKEQYSLMHPIISALPRDQEDILESYKKDPLESEYLLAGQNVDYVKRKGTVSILDENETFCRKFQPVEEPWLEESLLNGTYATENLASLSYSTDENVTSHIPVSDLELALLSNLPAVVSSCSEGQKLHLSSCRGLQTRALFDKDQPVEEPWLLLPHLAFPEFDTQSTSNALTRMKARDEEQIVEKVEQRNFVDENFSSERGSNLISDQDSISTDILINSSVCTMQRIAVLEDGKLVEILLEPVKNNVQCDSVYIGAVTKLVPHMGGAFVNIGNSRSSLMGINNKREPFIFPPFNKNSKVKDLDAFLLYELSGSGPHEHVIVDDDYEASDDEIEVDVQCGPATYENDDFEDHDADADDDVDCDEIPTKDSCVHDIQYDGLQAKFKDLSNHLNGNGSCIKDHTDPPQQSRVQKDNECKSSSRAQQLWSLVRKGTRIVVQVVKEGLGTKAPTLTAYPQLRSRFWILKTRSNNVGTSKKIAGVERARLRAIAKSLRPPGFGLTVRTVAAGHSPEELRKDLEGLLSTWRNIMEHAKSAALAAHEGVEGAVPLILHQARGQTLSVVQDYFTEKVKRMIVDSPRTYHEVTNYLQEIAPDLCNRVELHNKRVPLFDEFNIEEEINNILNKRVPLPNGGSLVIEQTEALVSIDVNGGHGMFGHRTSQEKAVLDVNLVAAKQIARELRLRDIGGIIVIDFIDMHDDLHRKLVYEEVKKAVERDRSVVKVSELSKNGLMEITRKRVRPSVTFMISEPCTCCHGTGRVEALETSFSKIEHEICRVLAEVYWKADPMKPKSWPRLLLRVDDYMCEYLTAGKKTRLATLSSSLKVWILLKVARSFTRGQFEIKLLADSKAADDQNQDGVSLAQPSEADDTSGPSKRTKLFSVKKWKIRGKR